MLTERTLREPIGLAAQSGHRRSYRALRRRVARKVWTVALGRRANLGLATPLPQIAHPVRAASRHPSGIPVACLLAHLLAVCREVLLGVPSLKALRQVSAVHAELHQGQVQFSQCCLEKYFELGARRVR